MPHGRVTLLLLAVVLTVSVVCIAGCPSKPKASDPSSAMKVPITSPAPAKAETKADAKAEPGKFTWTDKPTLEAIPSGPLAGMINGKPFTAKTVRIKKKDKGSDLEISDGTTDKPTGVLTSDTGADLTFDLKPGAPGKKTMAVADKKEFEKQHAYFHYPQGGDKGPMSVNPDWGCALEITEWKQAADPKDPDVLGTVKGKVVIVFSDDTKSWVAGTFEGVYCK